MAKLKFVDEVGRNVLEGEMRGKSMGENGDQHDEWDVCDQGNACHDAATVSPRPRIWMEREGHNRR